MESIFPIELEINVWKEVWKLTINDVHIEMMMDNKIVKQWGEIELGYKIKDCK